MSQRHGTPPRSAAQVEDAFRPGLRHLAVQPISRRYVQSDFRTSGSSSTSKTDSGLPVLNSLAVDDGTATPDTAAVMLSSNVVPPPGSQMSCSGMSSNAAVRLTIARPRPRPCARSRDGLPASGRTPRTRARARPPQFPARCHSHAPARGLVARVNLTALSTGLPTIRSN